MDKQQITSRARRADAQRNRDRILAAARRCTRPRASNISMASVARQTRVGKATISRHFTSPGELINAVFADRMDEYVQATRDALTVDDPWWAFVDYIWTVCEMQARDRGFADVLTLALPGAKAFEARRVQAYTGFLKVIERAHGAGHLQPGFSSSDMVLLLMANAGIIAATADAAPDSWRRHVAQVLRGWATPGAPARPMPVARHPDVHRAMARYTGIQ